MLEKKTVTVVGTGAVGGYYGALLQRVGHEVHFLLRSDFRHAQKNGLLIESCNGDFRLPEIYAHSSIKDIPPSDLVIIALKTTDNRILPAILPKLVSETGIVLTLQNGLGSEDEIGDIVGCDRVMGGLCFLCAQKIGPGHIRHLDYGLITVGEYRADGLPAGITSRLKQLGATLEKSGIPVRLEDNLLLARWKKLVWNIPFNGLSVIHNALTDELVENPETRRLCETLMEEVAKASAACAGSIEQTFIRKMMADTERMQPYSPSMKLDYERGNPMEIESMYRNPIRSALAAGVEMPETVKLYDRLKAMNPTDAV